MMANPLNQNFESHPVGSCSCSLSLADSYQFFVRWIDSTPPPIQNNVEIAKNVYIFKTTAQKKV